LNKPHTKKKCIILSFPDLPLCLGGLKHRAPLARGAFLPAKKNFYNAYNACGAILKLKAFCFGAIPDIMIELTACVGLPDLPPSGPK
jgi:hypothetical protein